MSRVQKRRRQIKQLQLIMVLLVAIFLIAMLSGFVFSGQSVKGSELDLQKTYESVVVYYGDTLWDIAAEYYNPEYYDIEGYMAEIMALNNMEHTNIQAGHTIMIPIVIE